MKNLYLALLASLLSVCSFAQVGTISGTPGLTVCVGSTTTLTDTPGGGTWYSLAPSVATIDSVTGAVTGVAVGTATISYDIPGTGSSIATVTVNALPTVYTVTGGGSYCTGSSLPTPGLSGSDAPISYQLYNGATAIGSPVTGTGSPLSFGTVSSGGTYSVVATDPTTGCNAIMTGALITINPSPSAIFGAGSLCAGATIGLSDTTLGGTWSSSSLGTASVTTGGVVTGVTAGAASITYSLPTGCFVTASVVVNPLPVISGTVLICGGSSSTLAASPGGGTWSSVNPAVGTVSSTGIVAAISAGVDTVTYMLPTGCSSMVSVTVNIQPTISGISTVCVGGTNTLSASPTGGTWTSSVPSTVGIGATTGLVTGFTAGSATITYTLPSGCFNTVPETVITTPPAITGGSVACVFNTILLSDAAAGGLWSSSNNFAATIGSSSGIVTGIATGTTIITYSFGGGCFTTTSVAVYNLPAPITGPGVVCLGHTITLSDTTSAGTWSSSGVSATVGASTGIVFGVGAGTETITYTAPTGCFTTTIVTVNTLPCSPTEINTVASQQITIAPNPAYDQLSVQFSDGTFTSMTITNEIGQQVMTKQITASSTIINVAVLPPAIYYLTLRGEQGTVVKRFVKQ